MISNVPFPISGVQWPVSHFNIMRTPEQTEQFKRDYLAQIDVNALNEVEKVLYAVAESKDLSNLPSMKLNKALEKLPMDSLEHSQLLQAGYHLPHLLPSWLSEMLSYLLAYRETKSDMRGLYRFRLSNSGELTPYGVREHVVAALMIALHGASSVSYTHLRAHETRH